MRVSNGHHSYPYRSPAPTPFTYSGWAAINPHFLFILIHTAFKLPSLWYVGYVLDDFYGF
jgi:hypothetical protein